MSDQPIPEAEPIQPMIYEIRVEGHLGTHWADVFDGLVMTLEDSGHTRLTGPIVDQAALHGLLRHIRDTGMTLVSIRRLPISRFNQSDGDV